MLRHRTKIRGKNRREFRQFERRLNRKFKMLIKRQTCFKIWRFHKFKQKRLKSIASIAKF